MSVTLAEALRKDIYQTKRALAEKMGCTTREVEHAVERSRKSGALPIMSGPDGYRLARNPDEYGYNVELRHKRAIGQIATVQGEKEYLERWRNQLNPPPPPTIVQQRLEL